MSTRLTPKRARDEQRRILLQTVFFLVLAIVLAIAMIVIVIPGLIRFAGSLTGITNPANDDSTPPRVPMYSAPVEATNTSRITVEGFGEPGSKLIAVLNSQEAGTSNADSEGKFSVEFALSEGENIVAIYAVDEAGNESALGREYTVVFDTTAPTLEWESPEDGKVVTNLRERMISIKGVVSEPNADLSLNDRAIFADSEGNFSTSFQLNEGENTLTLKAIDPAGNAVEASRVVSFRP